MGLRLSPLYLVAAVLIASPLYAADDAQPPLDRLKAAADLTAMDGSGMQPWHWKLDVTVFDVEGKNPKAGSLEIWSSGGNLRTVASLGSKQMTSLRIGSNLYRSSDEEKDLAGLRLIEMQVLHPIPEEVVRPSSAVKLVPQSAIKLDCMVPTVAPPSGDAVPVIQTVAFCFEQDSPKMLVTQEPGNFSIMRPRIGMFQNHQVPIDLQTYSGTVMVSEAKTAKLSAEAIDASLFQLQPGMGPINAPVTVPPAELRGLILSKSKPIYPPEAKERHIGGVVTLDTTIGKDGHVVSMQPEPQSRAALVASAKDAVSHWLFRPYLIDGLPVEVKTQITVTYAGGLGAPHGPSGDDGGPPSGPPQGGMR